MTDRSRPPDKVDEPDELASAYLDGALTPAEMARVERDPVLMARVETFRDVSALVARAPTWQVSQAEAQLTAALRSVGATPEADVVALRPRHRRSAVSALSALAGLAAALVLVVALVLASGGGGGGDDAAEQGLTAAADFGASTAAGGGRGGGAGTSVTDKVGSVPALSGPVATALPDLGLAATADDVRNRLATIAANPVESRTAPPGAPETLADQRCSGLTDARAIARITYQGRPATVFAGIDNALRVAVVVADCQVLAKVTLP